MTLALQLRAALRLALHRGDAVGVEALELGVVEEGVDVDGAVARRGGAGGGLVGLGLLLFLFVFVVVVMSAECRGGGVDGAQSGRATDLNTQGACFFVAPRAFVRTAT